ncbi:MAG TPA: hypothetical protein VE622_04305 [Nitrososphaeraceae archaeon]|nr:hypothetical protein [Nitrososphaeraceae archaeon]
MTQSKNYLQSSNKTTCFFTYKQERYAIVKSTGYHKLEPIIGKPITYSTSIQVPSSVLDIEN